MAGQTIALPYGRGTLEFEISASADILTMQEPRTTINAASFCHGVHELLPQRIPDGQIALVVADKTRLCGYPIVLPWLLQVLNERGVAKERIVFYIAYGTHAPQSEAESLNAYGPVFRDYSFIHHCSTDPHLFVQLGTTSRGTPVRIRKDLVEAGMILTVGAIAHHYFAGFGGGRKLLFPGLGEQQAIYHNHRLFLDSQRRTLACGCRPGQMEGNPIAEDLAEIDRMLPRYLSIHGLLDSHGTITAFQFGRCYNDFLQACQQHDRVYRYATDKRYDVVLASAGGYPKDINMIQAHKAIDNAAAFVRDGGTLIMLAECPDGIGSTSFLPYFAMGGWDVAFDDLLNNYSGNGGTALAIMTKTRRITISMITTLDRHFCEQMGITRITDGKQTAHLLNNDHSSIAVIYNSSLLTYRPNEPLCGTQLG
jgi:nickel-dependent lactate racemase